MDNLGLVFDTTNPFVNTGTPRPGQVYFRKKVSECMVHIISYNEYNDLVAYKIIETPTKLEVVLLREDLVLRLYNRHFKDKVLYCPKHHFLKNWVFSH